MFYLKNVILEIAQDGPKDECNKGGHAEQKEWQDWEERLCRCGIKVLRRQVEREEMGSEPNVRALLITDSATNAGRAVKKGQPVIGVIRGGRADQSFEGVEYLVSDLTEVEPEYFEKVYRRHAGIPWDVLETERCLVRETTAEDAEAFYEIYSDVSVTDYLEDLPADRDAFYAWLSDYRKHVYGFLGYGIWTVCLKGQTVIGRAGLTVREGFDQPELGFVIGKRWQGLGLAYEVCSAILEYAGEMGITEVIAFAEPENASSIRLLTRLGFKEEKLVNLTGRECTEFRISLRS